MLQAMRDKIQGLVAGVIAGLIALTFVLWGVQNYLQSGTSNVVAKVNGQEITQEQLRLAYERVKRNEMLRFGPGFSFDQKVQAKIKQDILQQLIKQEVIYRAETKMGLEIGRNQLGAVVASMPIFQSNGRFSPERFGQLMSGLFYSEQTFFAEMERSLLRVQLEKGVAGSSFVLPNEISAIKNIFKQSRDFGYFIVSPERFSKMVQISPDEIKQYYEKHQNDFLLPEKISIQYLELSSNDLQSTVKPTEEQLLQFYKSHIDSFSTQKKWQVTKVLLPLSFKADAKSIESSKNKINGIVSQVNEGKDISTLSSEVKVSTIWLSRNELSQEIFVHLDKLAVGQVSVPFRTKEGYNFLKVLAIEPAKATPYAKVADKVKQLYKRQQLTHAVTEANDRLADLVYTNSDTLEPAAKELGLKIKTSELFTSEGGKAGITANNKVVKTSFSDTVLKQRYNSNLIEIGSGSVVVLRVKDHIPETLQPLEKVRGIITERLKRQIVEKKGSDFANELLQALHDGKTQAQLASQYGLVWNKVLGVKYGQSGANAKLIEASFGLAKPKDKVVSAVIVELGDSYAVLRLDKVYAGQLSKETTKAQNALKSLPEVWGQFEYQTLINNFMHRAKIKIFSEVEDKQANV
ncbi:MAG: SurA N-terminal domain-containing protein [Gammaproteobacteria bacterium]|nr:SurA N-terminal domain-containing protein [Gammaproteobacteria bacterium]